MLCFAGCETAKSANPTSPSVAGPIPGVNITAPKPLEPYTGSQLTFTGQPQTLLIENADTNGSRALWLELEVGTDAQFQKIVHQADRIEPGSGGRTTYRMPSVLAAGNTYYWRTRALDGANSGPYSAVASFAIIIPVVIDAPAPIAPSGLANTNKPDFRVANATISGTSGVAYRFEVARTPDFSQVAAVVTVPVGGNGTTSMSLGELPYKTTFYWRVMGSDTIYASAYSMIMSFTTPDPPPPPPAPTPTAPVAVDASNWTSAQWKTYFMDLVHSRGYDTVSDAAMWAVRGDVRARGADFQNAWRGDIRPRIFLPVPGCAGPTLGANAPGCSYNRTVDFGNYGGAWQWIERF
jgi:hypothetical protein